MENRMRTAYLVPLLALLLTGCEIPGMGPSAADLKENDARAVGGACRHALRGIEDCYALNPKARKAAVFAGWKDMDAYMRENKIEGAPSVVVTAPPAKPAADEAEAEKSDKAPADKAEKGAKHS